MTDNESILKAAANTQQSLFFFKERLLHTSNAVFYTKALTSKRQSLILPLNHLCL